MTRFGVMKHLGVLERAGLITTRRQGRQKLHYLNPVPIRQVHDRWVSKYAEPWAAMLGGLKERLEERHDERCTRDSGRRPWTAGPTEKVFEIYIRTTPERLWEAITDPQLRRVQLRAGGPLRLAGRLAVRALRPAAGRMARARTSRSIPRGASCRASPRCGARTCRARDLACHVGDRAVGDSCRLTVTHDQMRADAHGEIYGGWPLILSGLKTLLETGEELTTPGSLRYS